MVDLEEDHRETVVEVGVGVLDLPLLLIVGMQRAIMERNLQTSDVSGLFAVLSALGVTSSSAGVGSPSGNGGINNKGGHATGFGCGGGGAGFYGGDGGNGLYGGGGGGASGYGAIWRGGAGGQGIVVVKFTGGSPSAVLLTSGTTSYTVPMGTNLVAAEEDLLCLTVILLVAPAVFLIFLG